MPKAKPVTWEKVLDYEKAYTSSEIATILDMHIITCRNKLRKAYFGYKLERARKGRFWLYALPKKVNQLETGKTGEIVKNESEV